MKTRFFIIIFSNENDYRYHLCYTGFLIISSDTFMLTINELQRGDQVVLQGFGPTAPEYRRRLIALGLNRGAEIRVVRRAPLGCPVQVEVRGVALTLRQEEACHLIWERLCAK